MLSTMQDHVPLTISRILRHGMTVHGDARITTWTGGAEPHRSTFRATGERLKGPRSGGGVRGRPWR